jgi:hypothetical protein
MSSWGVKRNAVVPSRARALERLERFDVARKLGTEHGLTPLPAPLPGMRGTLLACGQSAAGAPLVCVLDQ